MSSPSSPVPTPGRPTGPWCDDTETSYHDSLFDLGGFAMLSRLDLLADDLDDDEQFRRRVRTALNAVGQYSPLTTKYDGSSRELRLLPGELEPGHSSSMPSESLKPTARLPPGSSV